MPFKIKGVTYNALYPPPIYSLAFLFQSISLNSLYLPLYLPASLSILPFSLSALSHPFSSLLSLQMLLNLWLAAATALLQLLKLHPLSASCWSYNFWNCYYFATVEREGKILMIEFFLTLLEFSQRSMQSMVSNMKAYESYQQWTA